MTCVQTFGAGFVTLAEVFHFSLLDRKLLNCVCAAGPARCSTRSASAWTAPVGTSTRSQQRRARCYFLPPACLPASPLRVLPRFVSPWAVSIDRLLLCSAGCARHPEGDGRGRGSGRKCAVMVFILGDARGSFLARGDWTCLFSTQSFVLVRRLHCEAPAIEDAPACVAISTCVVRHWHFPTSSSAASPFMGNHPPLGAAHGCALCSLLSSRSMRRSPLPPRGGAGPGC